MTESPLLQDTIPTELAGERLDVVLARLFSDYSRSRLQEWIRAERVQINGQTATISRQRLNGGETVTLSIPQEPVVKDCEPQDIPLDIIYEDNHLLVINKPADRVMHPAAGNPDGTVLNALLYHYPDIEKVPRAGIVHRLDKDTTGLFVVAKTLLAHASLVDQLQTRSMGREYSAVVQGHMVSGASVDAPIGRHPTDRKRMAVRDNGKPAVTHYRIAEKFPAHTHINVTLESGRTHQIRVHMTHVQHPLVGDATYGGRRKFPKGLREAARQFVHDFPRQALHARKLRLIHPETQQQQEWESPLPDDINALLMALRETGADDDEQS